MSFIQIGFLTALLTRLESEVRRNRSTLIFTNTRGLAERVSWGLRRRYPAWLDEIAVHHSSLAAERGSCGGRITVGWRLSLRSFPLGPTMRPTGSTVV